MNVSILLSNTKLTLNKIRHQIRCSYKQHLICDKSDKSDKSDM